MRRRCAVLLDEAEAVTLQELATNHPDGITRRRAQALLRLGQGVRPETVAAEMGASLSSFYDWSNVWRLYGLCGLMSGRGDRQRRSKLSETQITLALAVARADDLSVAVIARRVEALLGEPLPCSIQTLRKVLVSWGFVSPYSAPALRRDPRDETPSAEAPRVFRKSF